MLEHVLSEAKRVDEGLRAQAALVRSLTSVGPPVVRQISRLQKRSTAEVTLEVALVAVCFEVPLQLYIMDVALATKMTEVFSRSMLPFLMAREAGARVEVFATLLTLVDFLLSVYSVNVFAEIASAYLCAANITFSGAWVAAVAVARQSLAGVKGLLAHLTSEGGWQAEAVPVMHLYMGVQCFHRGADSAAVLAREAGEIWMMLASVVVKVGQAGKTEGANRTLQLTKSVAPLMLLGACLEAEPSAAHPARVRKHLRMVRAQVCVKAGT